MKKTIRANVNNKLRSTAGESISETLVALLISALALVMLAGSISAASHMVTRSREKLGNYYDANEVLTTLSSSASATYAASGEGTITIGAGADSFEEDVTVLENYAIPEAQGGNKSVYAYKYNPPVATTP